MPNTLSPRITDLLKGDDDTEKKPQALSPRIMELLGQKPESHDRTVMGTLGDVGVTLAKAVVGVGESAMGLSDIPTFGHTGKIMESLGWDPKKTHEILANLYTPAQKAANLRVQNAKGFVETVKESIKNPSTIAHATIESLPLMFGGAGLARFGLSKVPALLKAYPKLAPVVAGAMGEGLVSMGMAAEQTRQETPDGLLTFKQNAVTLASGFGTGAIALAGGRMAQKLGITDVDTLLAGGITTVGTKGIIKRIIGGGLSEGVFEELPQSMQEQIWSNAAMDRPLLQGVGEAGAQGMLAGGLMGLGAGFVPGSGPGGAETDTTLFDEGVKQGFIDPETGEPTDQEPPKPSLSLEEQLNEWDRSRDDDPMGDDDKAKDIIDQVGGALEPKPDMEQPDTEQLSAFDALKAKIQDKQGRLVTEPKDRWTTNEAAISTEPYMSLGDTEDPEATITRSIGMNGKPFYRSYVKVDGELESLGLSSSIEMAMTTIQEDLGYVPKQVKPKTEQPKIQPKPEPKAEEVTEPETFEFEQVKSSFKSKQKQPVTGEWAEVDVSVLSLSEPYNVRGKVSDGNWAVRYETPSTLGGTGKQTNTEYFTHKKDAVKWINDIKGRAETKAPTVDKLRAEKEAKKVKYDETRKKKAVNAKTLISFLGYMGGVNVKDPSYSGELNDIRWGVSAKGKKVPAKGFPVGFFNKTGLSFDVLVTDVIEGGWLPPGSTGRDLLAAIENKLDVKFGEEASAAESQVDKDMEDLVDKEKPPEPTGFADMVKAAQEWKGAALNADRLYHEVDTALRLKHSEMTTKGDLDAYLMKKFGIDAASARSVSNQLTFKNLPALEHAKVLDYEGEPWADAAIAYNLEKKSKGAVDAQFTRKQITTIITNLEKGTKRTPDGKYESTQSNLDTLYDDLKWKVNDLRTQGDLDDKTIQLIKDAGIADQEHLDKILPEAILADAKPEPKPESEGITYYEEKELADQGYEALGAKEYYDTDEKAAQLLDIMKRRYPGTPIKLARNKAGTISAWAKIDLPDQRPGAKAWEALEVGDVFHDEVNKRYLKLVGRQIKAKHEAQALADVNNGEVWIDKGKTWAAVVEVKEGHNLAFMKEHRTKADLDKVYQEQIKQAERPDIKPDAKAKMLSELKDAYKIESKKYPTEPAPEKPKAKKPKKPSQESLLLRVGDTVEFQRPRLDLQSLTGKITRVIGNSYKVQGINGLSYDIFPEEGHTIEKVELEIPTGEKPKETSEITAPDDWRGTLFKARAYALDLGIATQKGIREHWTDHEALVEGIEDSLGSIKPVNLKEEKAETPKKASEMSGAEMMAEWDKQAGEQETDDLFIDAANTEKVNAAVNTWVETGNLPDSWISRTDKPWQIRRKEGGYVGEVNETHTLANKLLDAIKAQTLNVQEQATQEVTSLFEEGVKPTAKDKAQEAKQHLKNAADKFKQINDILGKKGAIGPELDEGIWEQILPLLKEAFTEILAAGKSGAEFVKISIKNLSPEGRPYFERFVKEEIEGKKEGATPTAKTWAYPKIKGGMVDGRTVTDETPNTSSIQASLTEYSILPGIREIQMSDIEVTSPKDLFHAADDLATVKTLAGQIKESGAISPLIVVRDAKGLYILEGAHRLGALHELGAKSFPALLVKDLRVTEKDSEKEPRQDPRVAAIGVLSLGKRDQAEETGWEFGWADEIGELTNISRIDLSGALSINKVDQLMKAGLSAKRTEGKEAVGRETSRPGTPDQLKDIDVHRTVVDEAGAKVFDKKGKPYIEVESAFDALNDIDAKLDIYDEIINCL